LHQHSVSLSYLIGEYFKNFLYYYFQFRDHPEVQHPLVYS
jgi:hypothetical protein